MENLSASSDKAVLLALTAAVFGLAAHKSYRGYQAYGTMRFVGTFTKWTAAVSAALLILQLFQSTRPYSPPPSDQFAIVLGNTQSSPKPSLSADTSEFIEESLLLHKGEEAEDVLSSMVFVSATEPPTVLPFDPESKGFVDMSTNSTRTKRDARNNVRELKRFLDSQQPEGNGASYLEAILEASRNISSGSITVIGSGLSDAGDVDFADDDLLTSEKKRAAKVEEVSEKYGRDYLDGFSVYFVGLGDTTAPQESLSPKQKDIVRDLYRDVIRALGGRTTVSTRSQLGDAVKSSFTVDTTDTGCGNVNYTFGEGDLEFESDQATFKSPSKAKSALQQRVVNVYKDDPSRVSQIQVDGYISLTPEQRKRAGSASEPLSQARANAVKSLLVDQGIPASATHAKGRGAGPHNDASNPGLDRMVKIKITRTENPDC